MSKFLKKVFESKFAVLATAVVFFAAGSINFGFGIVLFAILLLAWAFAQTIAQ